MSEERNRKNDEDELEEPRELPYLFEKELTEKQNRFICKISDIYIPTTKVSPITLKFYSKYDNFWKPTNRYREFVENSLKLPNIRFKHGFLESHRYGWYPQNFFTQQSGDPHFFDYKKQRTDLTIFAEELGCNRATERPRFNGVPFYLR